jgi:hypothetical protein
MGSSQGVYALVSFVGIFLGLVFFFIDGMLLWSVAFFVLGIFLVLFKIMWDVSGWADNAVRNFGDDS